MTSLWSNRRYLAWLVSDTAKGLAGGLFSFAVPLLALIVTDDPAQAGIIGAVTMVIKVSLMLFGGVLADRHRRVTLMILGAAIGVILSGAFTLLALGDALTFGTLLVISALLAARSGLLDTAGESALKDIVETSTMGRAQAANRARDAAMDLAGGPLGGALLAVGGWLIGAVMTLCHLISGAAAWLIPHLRAVPALENADETTGARRVEDQHADNGTSSPGFPIAETPKPQVFREIGEGLRWLFARPDLRGVLFIITLINLGANTATQTVIFSLQQDGYSPAVIGWVGAGTGAAMLLGALFAGTIVARVGAGTITILAMIVSALGTAGLALVHEPIAIVAVFAPVCLLLAPVNAALGGYEMVATPTELMGRVNSAGGVFSLGAMPLAPLIAGFGLSHLGRSGTILIGTAICAVAAALALSSRSLRSLPAEAGWAAHAQQFERASSGA